MMITRCPNCATSFHVTPEQLKAVHGKVRCGQCQQVFNAIDTLLDMATEPLLATESLTAFSAPELPLGEPAMLDASAEKVLVEETDDLEPRIELTDDLDGQVPQIEPLLHEDLEPAPRSRTWAWALAAALALLLLLLQLLLHFRVEVSVLLPDTKPLLHALCEPLGCDLPLPRKADLISIESSDLRPGTNNHLALAATLKNRAPFAQAYPHLEVTLTDTADQPILRKVLAPTDYLPKAFDLVSGFATNREITIDLALVHDSPAHIVASGYRLYLFYP